MDKNLHNFVPFVFFANAINFWQHAEYNLDISPCVIHTNNALRREPEDT